MARSSSDEPSEAPSPRRLLEAQRRGLFGVSRDLSDALGFGAFVLVVAVGAGPALTRVGSLFRAVFSAPLIDPPAVTAGLAGRALDVAAGLTSVPLAAALAAAVVTTALQTRGALVWRSARRDPGRLTAASILARLVHLELLPAIARSAVKVAFLAATIGFSATSLFRVLPRLAGGDPRAVIAGVGVGAKVIGISSAVALLAWGALDWALARRRHQRALMMTTAEARRERRDAEGDPLHKAAHRRLHRETVERRLADDVRRADFLVTGRSGSDLRAVAVGYDRAGLRAPTVLVRGQRLVAASLVEIARASGVPVHLDDDLAVALGDVLEGSEIPEGSYQTVAELLRVSWRAR